MSKWKTVGCLFREDELKNVETCERGKIGKGHFFQYEVKKLDFVSQVHLKVWIM